VKVCGDSKVTQKYQVTIPPAVRERLKLKSGDRLIFVQEASHVVIVKGKLEIDE